MPTSTGQALPHTLSPSSPSTPLLSSLLPHSPFSFLPLALIHFSLPPQLHFSPPIAHPAQPRAVRQGVALGGVGNGIVPGQAGVMRGHERVRSLTCV